MNDEYIVSPSEEHWFFGGAVTRIVIAGHQTAQAFALLHITSPPKRSTPIHRHDREEETVYVLDGKLRIDTEEGSRTLSSGETMILARGKAHRITNDEDVLARSLVFCTPAGFENFVRETGEPAAATDEIAPPVTPIIKHRMSEAAPRHGIALMKELLQRA